jgi:RimJ/RimL family protein N-acetyltransferase
MVPIQSHRLRIRLLEGADLATTLALRNQPHVRRWFFDDRAITPTAHQAWFQQYLQRDDDFVFVLEDAAPPPEVVGQIGLYRIDWHRGTGEYGRLIVDDRHRSRGLGTEATLALLTAAFSDWGLKHIVARVYANNAPSLRLFDRCGFELVSTENGVCCLEVTPATLTRLALPTPAGGQGAA